MFDEEFAKLPAEAPRRLDALPGLRLRGSIPRAALIVPLFFVMFLVVMPLSLMRSDPAMRLATGPTESAQGQVLSNTGSAACRDESAHRVVYSFETPVGEYRGTANLCATSPDYSVRPGDRIAVRYLKGDPAVNAPQSQRQQEPPPRIFFLFMPFFFLAIFAGLYWPSIREILKARRLFKNGKLTVAKVVFVKKRGLGFWPGLPLSSSSEVYVKFATPLGATREGIATCQNDWLLNQLPPGAGVHIAYSDDASTNVALLDAYVR
jgi:hypothetical protein